MPRGPPREYRGPLPRYQQSTTLAKPYQIRKILSRKSSKNLTRQGCEQLCLQGIRVPPTLTRPFARLDQRWPRSRQLPVKSCLTWLYYERGRKGRSVSKLKSEGVSLAKSRFLWISCISLIYRRN